MCVFSNVTKAIQIKKESSVELIEYWPRFVREKEIVLCVKEFNQIEWTPPTAPTPAVSDQTAVHVSAGISSFVGSAATATVSKVDLSKIKTFNQLQPASVEYTLKVNCVEKIQLKNRDIYVLVDRSVMSNGHFSRRK